MRQVWSRRCQLLGSSWRYPAQPPDGLACVLVLASLVAEKVRGVRRLVWAQVRLRRDSVLTMKRAPFRKTWTPPPKLRDREPGSVTASPGRRASMVPALLKPAPKAVPARSPTYREIVASFPCINCGIVGHSQHAHANEGKGMGTKTDDRAGFPLCGPRPGHAGCHAEFDQGRRWTRDEKRALAKRWGSETRMQVKALGLWPANLERWSE